MSAEFDELVAQYEKFQAKMQGVDDRLAGIGQMQEELAELEATATSADRSITVVSGPGGSIKDIRIGEEALRHGAAALSASVMSTVRQAVAESARRQAAVVDAHVGGQTKVTDQVLETQAELLGKSVDELRSLMDDEGSNRSSQVPRDDHGYHDYSHRSWLSDAGPAYDRPGAPPPQHDEPGSAGQQFIRDLLRDQEGHR